MTESRTPPSTPILDGYQCDSSKLMTVIKDIVMENYNVRRNPGKAELCHDDITVVSFTILRGNWRAFIISSLARGLIWEANCTARGRITLNVYNKINNVKLDVQDYFPLTS
jgi:hypothetical protein